MKKRFLTISILLVFVLSFCMAFTGCNENDIPVPQVRQDVFIYDDENIIDNNIENTLNTMLIALEKETEVEFAVITTPSLQNHSIESYANHVFNTLGIGKKEKDNGILLLMSRSDNRVRLEIGRGLEGVLNDSKCGRILDEFFVPYREKDDYNQATNLTVQAVLNVLCTEYEITINGLDTRSVQMEEPEELSPLAIVLIVIGVIVLLFLLEWITGHIFGDGFGDGLVTAILFSGNSSGGSSGGGFGGGFSGGGGASR